METILSYSGLLFLPLISLVSFGITTVVIRVVRWFRSPGFSRGFDRELSFLTRGPKLLAAAAILLFVGLPTLIGVLRPASPRRHPGPESPVIVESPSFPGPEAPASRETSGEERSDGPAGRPPPRRQEAASTVQTADVPESEALSHESKVPATRAVTDPRLVPVNPAHHALLTTLSVGPEEAADETWLDEQESVDVLFIHAHPDDESLDFGVLMSALARNGLRIATVLLTDGEGGIDRYPNRPRYEDYPMEELSAQTLRTVRVGEAQRALSILGSALYIRLGLTNHPYNGTADELPLEKTISAWGGEEKVVDSLALLIVGLQPRLVVSPDAASEAREHFEHEATGYLVRKAVARAAEMGHRPDAHLVSVDPFQRGAYQETVSVPAVLNETDLRGVQGAALSQHHTQADASVIGLSRLRDLSREYYSVVYWELEESLVAFAVDRGDAAKAMEASINF